MTSSLRAAEICGYQPIFEADPQKVSIQADEVEQRLPVHHQNSEQEGNLLALLKKSQDSDKPVTNKVDGRISNGTDMQMDRTCNDRTLFKACWPKNRRNMFRFLFMATQKNLNIEFI
jgi:hypothetical protein